MNPDLTIPIFSGLIGMLGWGLGDFFAQRAVSKDNLTEGVSGFWMNVSGVLSLLFILLLNFLIFESIPSFSGLTASVALQIVLLGTLNFVAYLFFFKALKEGELGVISSIMSTYAAGSIFVSVVFFGESISSRQVFSLLVVVLGVALVSLKNIREFKNVKGVKWVIPATIIFSVFFPFWDRVANEYQSFSELVLVTDMVLAILYLAFIAHQKELKELKLYPPKSILLSGIFTTMAALGVTWGFQNSTETSVISVVSSAVPLTSCILGYIFLKERLSITQYMGVLSIICGGALLFS